MRLLEFLSRLGRKEEEYLVCDKCGRKAKARRFRQKDFTIEFLLGRGRKHEECMRENVALVCRRCGFILCYRCTKGGLPSISCCPKCGEEHMPIFLVELTSEAKKIQKLADKGDALRRAGKYQKAITCYDNALSVNRNDPELYAAKADCLLKLGLPEEALDCYDLALQIDPKADYIWGLKGNTLQDLGRIREAVQCWDRYLQLNPGDDGQVFLKACALYDAGMLDEALSSFETALAINQGNAEAWFYKGKALESLGRKTEAEECFQRASRLREP